MRKYSRNKHVRWTLDGWLSIFVAFGAGILVGFGLWMMLWIGNA